jgi:hypothetical protein
MTLAPSLSSLKSLKVLVMPAVNAQLKDTTREKAIITQWSKSMPCLRAVLMPSKKFFICTKACSECCERLKEREMIVGHSRGVMLCPHANRALSKLWISHDSVED